MMEVNLRECERAPSLWLGPWCIETDGVLLFHARTPTCVYLLLTLGAKLNFKINYNFQIEPMRRLSAVVKVCAKKLHGWIYAVIKFQSLLVTSTCWFDRFGKRGENNPLNAPLSAAFVQSSAYI